MPYTTWPSAATRAKPAGGSVVAQPGAGSLAVAGMAPVALLPSASFTDTFASNANPIASPWTKTANSFKSVLTNAGAAYSAAYNDGNLDAYCILATSAFTAPSDDYEVTVKWIRNSFGLAPGETEVMVRLSDSAGGYNCYEILVNNGGGELVRIDGGGPGGFTEFGSTAYTISAWEGTGDLVRVRVTGTNPVRIQMWHAPASAPTTWTQYIDYSDSDAARKTTGQPGMGFYNLSADGNLGNCGWQEFSVAAYP